MKLTPSAAPRAYLCPPSVTLPQTYSPPSPAAQRGTAMHADLARRITAGESPVPGLPWHGKRHVEVALAYDVQTERARILGYDLGRKYPPVNATELKGSADLVLLHDGQATLVDWKSGQRHDGPENHWQVRLYALMVARAFGVSVVHGVLAWLDHDILDRWTFDALELDAAAADLRALLDRIAQAERGEVEPTPGDHCRWCPAKPACPKMAAAVSVITANATVPASAWMARATQELQTPEGAQRVYQLYRAAKEVSEALSNALRDAAPVRLPDTTLRLVPSSRVSVSAEKLATALRKHLPDHAEAIIAEATSRTEYTQLRQEKNR